MPVPTEKLCWLTASSAAVLWLPLETVGWNVILFGGPSVSHTRTTALLWFPACCLSSETLYRVCVYVLCVCVCVYVPRERLLCPVVFTYTQFPAGSKPAGVWSELSEWPLPDIPPAAPTTSALSLSLSVCMFLRKSSVHDPNTEHRHRPEYSHTHPDNHTRLIIIITPNKWVLKYQIHALSSEFIFWKQSDYWKKRGDEPNNFSERSN